MSDTELLALSTLANIETMARKDVNDFRLANGDAPAFAYIDDGQAARELAAELRRRGVLS